MTFFFFGIRFRFEFHTPAFGVCDRGYFLCPVNRIISTNQLPPNGSIDTAITRNWICQHALFWFTGSGRHCVFRWTDGRAEEIAAHFFFGQRGCHAHLIFLKTKQNLGLSMDRLRAPYPARHLVEMKNDVWQAASIPRRYSFTRSSFMILKSFWVLVHICLPFRTEFQILLFAGWIGFTKKLDFAVPSGITFFSPG